MTLENVVPLRGDSAAAEGVPSQESDEEYAPSGNPLFTRVPDDEYVVGLVSCKKPELYQSRRWKTVWRVVEGSEAGKELLYYIPALIPGTPPKPGFKMYGVYCVATGRRPPRDLWRRNPKSFLAGALFLARVGKVKRDFQGAEIPEPARYSVIRALIRRVGGVPKDCQVEE